MKTMAFCACAALCASLLSAQGEKTILVFDDGFEPGRVFAANGPLSLEKLPGAMKITTLADSWWPGYAIAFPDAFRDLSSHGGVALDIENPENFAQSIGFRVDNAGADGRKFCNTEGYTLEPGEKRTISVWFGHTDRKPAFPLDTTAITGVCLFWNQPKRGGSLILRHIRAIPPDPALPPILAPREHAVIDFNTDEGVALSNPRGGAWTDANGRRVLSADTMPAAKQWFEFWESRPGLLAGNHAYAVKLTYRVLDADDDAVFYALFRSQGKGWGKWDRGWTNINELPAKKGRTLTQEFNVELPRFKDYFMMLGVNGRASVAVESVEITQGEPFADDGDLAERAAAKRNANAARHIMADFEDALPETARVGAGETTENPLEVLLGKRSLVVDTIGADREWNEFFGVGRGRLEPGYKYFVTAPVRMEKKGPKGGSVYVAAAPLNEGPNNGKIGWRSWNSGPGEDDILATTFSFREDRGYELILGVHNEARVIVDDIEIRREPLPPDRVPSLKVRNPADMKLVFEDTFDGPAVDAAKWNIEGDHPWRGGVVRKANAVIEDNNLVLLFQPDGDTFSLATLNTREKHAFTHGYFEARMMAPRHEGHWPAFWLFSDRVNHVGDDGRDGTEIDIMEAPWRGKDQINHALHWDGYGDDHASDGVVADVPGVNEGWHTFALDWQPDGYIFLIDGRETWRADSGGVCENPLWIILSDELGGWSGEARNVDKALFPDKTRVDYVRVWQ